ncbi:MAG TPA: class I SAM-dependent methyltransferase [Gaiellaceae bacterium]|nr:class I SAM-dependent methyltransferase [Gaiellaceae bacterium]
MNDWFSGDVAERYDTSTAAMPVEPVVDFLLPFASGGALELAIGTGRIAVPLAARGVRVAGIDLSPDMVAQLRKKTDELPVAIGDMAETTVDGTFSLVYILFNSIFNLRTQDAQVACFENASAHLEPGGAFVIELMVPEVQRLPRGDKFLLFDARSDHVGFDEFDLVTQGLTSHHYNPERGTYSSFPGRYIWPAELDLMARIAGLTLRERWADWDRSPFTAESEKHISVWQKT